MIKVCNRIIEYSFYCLFLLVPLAFSSATSELFELNKMWLTWGLTIVIAMAWIIKMVFQKRILFQRTPLDIPIFFFLASQIVSTIFSWDVHVSVWGYYSRFNGGLLSIISYILLYYAFLSNFSVISSRFSRRRHSLWRRTAVFESKSIGSSVYQSDKLKTDNWTAGPAIKTVKRLLSLSLISGLVVALWGLPSHFGYDPTCLLFRGTLDVSCWTADFMPTIRIFSTLGQPDWLAAYLAILLPITLASYLNSFQSRKTPHEKLQIANSKLQKYNSNFKFPMYIFYLLLTILFYLDLLYTRARSGILGIWIALIFFAAAYFWFYGKPKFSILIGIFLITTFIIGTPFNQIRILTLGGITSQFQKLQTQKNLPAVTDKASVQEENPKPPHEPGGTESGDIRLSVWKGAINAWKHNPIFGTGVETFAFAYYKYKPGAHNLTSEWNFLYNKAHNEYLNYLATTGIIGLGSYLFMIGYFLFLAIKKISNSKFLISNQIPSSKSQLGQLEIRSIRNLALALLASYLSILITNLFGFSVVITNIYLFMIPAFVFVLGGMTKHESEIPTSQMLRGASKNYESRNLYQWTSIFFIILASFFMILKLFRFWQADMAYALGYNLDRAGEYQKAYPLLHKAVELRGDEPVFKDELSINDAIIAAGLLAQVPSDDQKQQTISVATSLVQEAINTSNEVVSKSPNNAVFWKTRVRLFYTLSQVDTIYLPKALEGIEKASLLAPADANIWYNLGVLYGQNNNLKKGITALEKTVKLKPNYRDAHYALGLFYHTASLDAAGKVVVNETLNQKALAQMQYILDHIARNDAGALESITNWSK